MMLSQLNGKNTIISNEIFLRFKFYFRQDITLVPNRFDILSTNAYKFCLQPRHVPEQLYYLIWKFRHTETSETPFNILLTLKIRHKSKYFSKNNHRFNKELEKNLEKHLN